MMSGVWDRYFLLHNMNSRTLCAVDNTFGSRSAVKGATQMWFFD